ncbi:prolipoprotein diacylglyceryl transferase [Candidatus Falkowbacteria bacterium]|nr:prolipoprotein diacylglyceryl transferase [Candidatus Falkowbacteria bacterium]
MSPNPIALNLGVVQIHWYGLLIVLGAVLGSYVVIVLARRKGISKDTILDLVFYLAIFGILGARLYYVLYDLPYYLAHPIEIPLVWHGGLGIFGAIIAGALTTYIFCRIKKISFFVMTDLLVFGLIIGQIFGRMGNFFNQELYGAPTTMPWGIAIDSAHRMQGFENFTHFHPTFLYESILNLTALGVMWVAQKQTKGRAGVVTGVYFIMYGIIRAFTETLRIDWSPEALGMRVGFWFASGAILVGVLLIIQALTYSFTRLFRGIISK